jgi:hypothetical protein
LVLWQPERFLSVKLFFVAHTRGLGVGPLCSSFCQSSFISSLIILWATDEGEKAIPPNWQTAINLFFLDRWGGETVRSGSPAQPRKYTAYERDADGGDEAMFRRYEGRWQRFAQPDPYDGSYDAADPQTFNRYSYTGTTRPITSTLRGC